MDERKSIFAPKQRRRMDEPQSISNFWDRREGTDPYPSSFYTSSEKEHKETSLDKPQNKGSGPLILPPPPTVSMDRKKMIVPEREPEKEQEPVRTKREEEIISLPDDYDDDILFEKKEQVKSEFQVSHEEVIWEAVSDEDEQEPPKEFFEQEEEALPLGDDDWFIEQEVKERSERKEINKQNNEKRELELIRARLPVLLMKDDFEIDIFDSFTLMLPLTNVSKVDWKVHSFKGFAIPQSSRMFLELILSAEIEFVSKKNGSLHTLKIYVPLQKTVSVNWISQPDHSHTNSREYYFKEKDGLSVSTHREWEETLVPDIKFHLNSFKVIWHEEISRGKQEKTQLGIQGTARISVEASQEQTVSIHI
jgi:hypothetical protein